MKIPLKTLDVALEQGPKIIMKDAPRLVPNSLTLEQNRQRARESTIKRKIAAEAYWSSVRQKNLDRVMKYRFGTEQ